VVVAAVIAGAGLLSVGFLALRPADGEVDEEARVHAQAACDLSAKAGEAAQVGGSAPYAASLFLLDRAIVESGRAAESASEFTELDQAVQAVHTAAHRGSAAPYQDALDATLATCRDLFG